jgi:hypothetical protein
VTAAVQATVELDGRPDATAAAPVVPAAPTSTHHSRGHNAPAAHDAGPAVATPQPPAPPPPPAPPAAPSAKPSDKVEGREIRTNL